MGCAFELVLFGVASGGYRVGRFGDVAAGRGRSERIDVPRFAEHRSWLAHGEEMDTVLAVAFSTIAASSSGRHGLAR